MDTSLPDNIAAFAASLSPRQRAVLLQTLLSGPGISRRHDNRCLETIEQTLWQQACRPASPERGYANGRVWLIYMLLRYGAMRLKEILRLREGDMDFGAGRICAGGRTVLLGPVIAARLAAFWCGWPGRASGEYPLACDASILRRKFARLGRSCGCEGLNARFLRKSRGRELLNGGLHPDLVAWFMNGKTGLIDPRDCEPAIRLYLNKENIMKTSARNVFHGIVAGISENGILSSVSLETSNKLVVTAIITNTSRKNLNLERGTPAVALVKAPWVSIAPSSGRAAISPGNSFQGEVETIRRDELACEIQVRLDQGGLICSLYANGACPEAEIETGSCVIASFSPFSVILIES